MNYHEQSVKDFVDYYRNIFADKNSVMEKFEEEYRHRTPIGWYISENFIYSMINRALRTHHINTIEKMAFLISGIHQQIEKLHSIQFSDKQDLLTVYRGQSLGKDQLKKLQECKDGFISFNHFLLTTEDRQIAFTFAENHRIDNDSVRILFQITTNSGISTTPYACIDEFINNNDKQQIVFSMHSIFHIDNIKIPEESDQIWIVELKMINDNEPLLKVLTKRLRQKVQDATGWHRLGQLLVKLEHFDKAEEVYKMLVDQCASDNSEKATFLNHLGNIRHKQGDHVTAIMYYKVELRILNKLEPLCCPRLIDGYNNLGLMYLELEYYPEAFMYFESMLRLQQLILPKDHPTIAASYTKIGHFYNKMNDHRKAISFYEKALDIFKRILPSNHPDLAVSNNLIADMYNKMDEYSQAFQYYQKALEIKHKIAPREQPNSTRPSNSTDALVSSLSECFEVMDNLNTAITILEKTKSSDKSHSALCYNKMGLLCNRMGNYSEALEYCEQALTICKSNHPALSVSYHNIGQIYQSMQEYSQALTFYQKALEIVEKNPSKNHENIADIYSSIAELYMKTFDYSQSLLFYKKALEIQEKHLPANHFDLGVIYNKIGEVYRYMGDPELALAFRERFLSIAEFNLEKLSSKK